MPSAWLPTTKLKTASSATAALTTSTTAAVRGIRICRSQATGGASMKLNRMASANGTKISRPTYSTATAVSITATVTKLLAGLEGVTDMVGCLFGVESNAAALPVGGRWKSLRFFSGS